MTASRQLLTLLTILAAIALLLTFHGSAAAEDYDLTNCSSGTITPITSGQDLTIFLVDAKGIARASGENKAFDNNSFHCVSLVRLNRGQRSGNGVCRFVDPDGARGGHTARGSARRLSLRKGWLPGLGSNQRHPD